MQLIVLIISTDFWEMHADEKFWVVVGRVSYVQQVSNSDVAKSDLHTLQPLAVEWRATRVENFLSKNCNIFSVLSIFK